MEIVTKILFPNNFSQKTRIISVENVSLENQLKSVTIWDHRVKFNTGIVIRVVELLIIGYLFFKYHLRVLLGSQRVILGHLDPWVPSVAQRSDFVKLL